MISKQRTSTGITRTAFKREVRTWSRRIGVQPKEVHLRRLKSKQASCSPHGRLTFNLDLLNAPSSKRSEVIVHELVHLKIPNHGRLFKQIMLGYLKHD